MALAFEGDPDFIRRSINFAINFLVQGEHVVRQLTPTFVVVNTSMERLEDALYREAFARERLKLAEQFPLDNALAAMDDEDFPPDFEERCTQWRADLWAAANPKETAEVMQRDPTRGIFPDEDDPALEAKAKELALNSVKEQMDALVFEDFMRQFSHAGLQTHDVAETA
jgi:hypothetical protein